MSGHWTRGAQAFARAICASSGARFILSLAVTRMKMTPAEAFNAATINAAYSIGRGSDTGSLEPGKFGDFVIYEARDWREIVYWIGVPLVRCVYIGGRLVWPGKG